MTKERIAIVADSCGDIPAEIVQELGITIVPLQVIFGDKHYRDGVDLGSEEFYHMLMAAKDLPTTTQPSPEVFIGVYEELLKSYDKIISIHISHKLSGTLQSANIAAQEFDGRVITWDTLGITGGAGMQTCAAAEAVNDGATVEEVMELLLNIRDNTEMLFSLDTLEYLRKGGRIGSAESLLGSVLKIKPIIIVIEGYYHAYGKARSSKKAIKTMLDYFIKLHRERPVKRFVVGQFVAEEMANYAQEVLEKEFGIKASINFVLGPVIATHVGPGAYGIAVSHY